MVFGSALSVFLLHLGFGNLFGDQIKYFICLLPPASGGSFLLGFDAEDGGPVYLDRREHGGAEVLSRTAL